MRTSEHSSESAFERLNGVGALWPLLSESLVVVTPTGTVREWLGPPQGPLGLGDPTGTSIFDYCHPDELNHLIDVAITARDAPEYVTHAWTARLRHGSGTWRPYELRVLTVLDEPTRGFVLRLRELDDGELASGEPTVPVGIAGARPLIELAPCPIVAFGPRGLACYANEAARSLFGGRFARLEIGGLPAVATAEERSELKRAFDGLLASGREITVSFHMASWGRPMRRRLIEATLRVESIGPRSWVVGTFSDITAREAENAELRRRARSDALTRLANRSGIESIIEERLGQSSRVGFVCIDLTGLKRVNNAFSLAAGDRLLVTVGAALSRALRPGDEIGRIGGDESGIVTDLIEVDKLLAYAQDLADAVNAGCRNDPQGADLDLTVGVAVATPDDHPRDLLVRADEARRANRRAARA